MWRGAARRVRRFHAIRIRSLSAEQRKVSVQSHMQCKGKATKWKGSLEHHGVSVMIHHSPISFNGLSTAASQHTLPTYLLYSIAIALRVVRASNRL